VTSLTDERALTGDAVNTDDEPAGPPGPVEVPPPPDSDEHFAVAEPEPPPAQSRSDATWADDRAYILDHRYVVLCGLVLLAMVSYLAKHTWPGGVDIWEHAAAARELGAHPLNPGHPLLAIDRPHQYFSPYLLIVGLTSRFTALSVIDTLNVWGVVNLVLLFVGLRLFASKLTTRKHVDYYALLFILFLWGPGAWFFSGFLHFDIIALVLTYPSTFCKGLVFLSLWAHLNYLETADRRWLVPTLAISSVIFLTHPADQLFLTIGLAALTVTATGARRYRRLVLTAATVGVAFLLALLWPYMSLWHILFSPAAEGYRDAFKAADSDLYVNILSRCGLALIVLPFVVSRLKGWRRDPLVVMFLGTLAVYVFGLLTDDATFGRLISSVQVVGALILAEERIKAGDAAVALGAPGVAMVRWLQITTAAIVVAGMFFLRNGVVVLPDRFLTDVPYGWAHSYVDNVKISDFDFLAKNHKTYPVVMSDLYTSLELPAFGSKVVSFARAQAFVDTSDRNNDMSRFYDPASTVEVRRAVLEKYGVSLIVVPVNELTSQPKRHLPLLDLGRVVSLNARFVFVDVRSP
jgi:hypothetical protein